MISFGKDWIPVGWELSFYMGIYIERKMFENLLKNHTERKAVTSVEAFSDIVDSGLFKS